MKKIVFLSFIFSCSINYAQQSNFGNWLIYIGNKQIAANWNWHSEIQYRNYNAIGDLEQLLIRTGIGYNLTEKNNNVLLGYAFIHGENYIQNSKDKVEIDEHRIFQQFTTRQDFGRVKFQHRYRFEQRFQESNFGTRFRYFLAMTVSLNNKELVDNTMYFACYNEIFLRDTKQSAFDRNRLYGGLGYKFNNAIRIELGYMNQFLSVGERDQFNIFAYLNF